MTGKLVVKRSMNGNFKYCSNIVFFNDKICHLNGNLYRFFPLFQRSQLLSEMERINRNEEPLLERNLSAFTKLEEITFHCFISVDSEREESNGLDEFVKGFITRCSTLNPNLLKLKKVTSSPFDEKSIELILAFTDGFLEMAGVPHFCASYETVLRMPQKSSCSITFHPFEHHSGETGGSVQKSGPLSSRKLRVSTCFIRGPSFSLSSLEEFLKSYQERNGCITYLVGHR